MADVRQQITSQLEAYQNLELLKAAVRQWVNASDGSLDALEKALEAHQEEDYLTDEDWQQLAQQGLAFDSDAATYAEDMQRIQSYRKTGHAIAHEEVSAWLQSRGTDDELPCPR
jgi:hypothetical protein